jgi:thiol-disulfide isomerase/thioredoxin
MVRIHAPELPQDQAWLNTERPLSLQTLKGRVVLLDFWTYGCINCLHILPDLKYLEQKYKDCLTVIGVHSAKFKQEQAVEHIRQAILRYDIEHPVLVDDSFQVWQQYTVRAWPTVVVIDPQGYVIGSVVGEGKRQVLDDLIAKMVQANRDQINFAELSQTLEKQNIPDMPLAFPGKVLADAASDRLFIADTGHHRIVITSLTGAVQETIGNGQAGLWDGTFDEAQFAAPQGMAFDSDHQILYIADTENHAIRKLNLQHRTVETLAGTGAQSRTLHPHSGKPHEVALNSPWDLEQFHQFLLIAMAGSHQIWALNLKEAQIGTLIGTGAEACVDGGLAVAAFAQPSGISSNGKELFVADSEGSAIRAVELDDSPRVRTVCGSGDLFGFGDRDGQGEAVRLQHCLGVAWGRNSQVWIADTYNHKIKQVDSTGLCRTVLGNGCAALQDGLAQTASFYEPSGLSLAGNWLYIADTNNHAIRRANLTTLEVETLTFPDLCAPTLCFKPNG